MSFSSRHGATTNIEKWNLDSLGYINSFSEVQNDPYCLRRLTNKLELAQSLASIYYADVKESATHKAARESETRLLS